MSTGTRFEKETKGNLEMAYWPNENFCQGNTMHPYLSSGVTLSLWANSLKRELCPVTALFTWLLITGLFIYIRIIHFIS